MTDTHCHLPVRVVEELPGDDLDAFDGLASVHIAGRDLSLDALAGAWAEVVPEYGVDGLLDFIGIPDTPAVRVRLVEIRKEMVDLGYELPNAYKIRTADYHERAHAEFLRLWRAGVPVRRISAAMGITYRTAMVRAHKLRRRGVACPCRDNQGRNIVGATKGRVGGDGGGAAEGAGPGAGPAGGAGAE